MDYFMHNRIYDIKNIDLIIELYVLNQTMAPPPDFILAYFCKIVPEKDQNGFLKYNIKPLYSKCKVQNSDWYHLEDIFGLNSEESMCEICCCEKKNTYFEPCKHSYACKDCAIQIRLVNNKCPICRRGKYIYNFIIIILYSHY
jgi:hypothetical protein